GFRLGGASTRWDRRPECVALTASCGGKEEQRRTANGGNQSSLVSKAASLPLRELRAVVTGAGRGVGRATAVALASSGARVLLCSRTESEVAGVASEIRQRTGSEALA